METVRRWAVTASVVAMAGLVVPAARGSSNLLPNGDFDQDASGWTFITPGDGFAAWGNSPDACACAASGSYGILNTSGTDGGEAIVESDCLPANGEVDDRLSGEFSFVIPSSNGALAYLVVDFFDDSGCDSGSPLAEFGTGSVLDDVSGFQGVLSQVAAPSGTAFARVFVVVQKLDSNDTVGVGVDHVALVPASAVFEDDLEVGETCRWSGAQL